MKKTRGNSPCECFECCNPFAPAIKWERLDEQTEVATLPPVKRKPEPLPDARVALYDSYTKRSMRRSYKLLFCAYAVCISYLVFF